MSAVDILSLVARSLGLLALLQSIEFFALRRTTSDQGVWRWRDLENELGKPFRFLLSAKAFEFLNLLRALVAIDVIFTAHAHSVVILFFLHVLTLLRWLGTYNGGSDYMNLLLLWLTSLGLMRQGTIASVCVYYMVFQLCLSYFKAGWIKLNNPNWRAGLALPAFLNSPIYESKDIIEKLTRLPILNRMMSWMIILYEVSFPLAILNRNFAAAYLLVGAFFHLGNAYIFGLNRFFFAWLAAYPALFYLDLLK